MTFVPLDPATRSTRRRPHLLALEPRMMFDAAAAVVAQDMLADGGDAAHPFADRTVDAQPTEARHVADDPRTPNVAPVPDRTPESDHRAIADTTTPSRDVIFIDTSVADYRQLASEWAERGTVVLIDGTGDGIAQMRDALAGQSGIGAIHIVSHGEQGQFWLGTTRVDTAAITGGLASALGEIGDTLAPGGDILIYGCDFAEGTEGAAALAAFADATHADVAASTDVTGYAGRGGDWTLEAQRGTIEARSLDSADWAHTLDPNTPVPISVIADSLTVTYNNRDVVTGTTGYGSDNRSPDVGAGAVATWRGAATYQGQSVDLRATVVSISAGDMVRFSRPGIGANGDDPTFLLRDLTTANDATVEIRWELVLSGTNTALPADVRFTIADIDGIGGNPNTRESVTASTTNLAYFTRERVSDINFTSSLAAITASGTQNENTDTTQPVTPKSAATFDWSHVSAFTLTYKLTTNAVTTQAQFFHDGDADFVYSDPVYVSVPRLDLDSDDTTATGNDAHFTFTENGPDVPIVDGSVDVTNPMDTDSITGATVRLTNWQAGDTFTIGTLPANVTATIGPVTNGTQTITLTGLGCETDYEAALLAIRFGNTSDTPATVQRVIDISFSNDMLTSAIATSRIDVVPVNDAPTAVNDAVTTAEDTTVTFAVLGNDTDPEGDTLTVTAASALHGAVMRNADGTLTYMPAPDYNGADTITYTISDGHGGTSTATVAVTVTPVNDAPDAVATLPSRSTTDAATVSYATAAAFSDRDGDALTYSATGLPAGLTINATTGVISGTVNRSASQTNGGNYTVTVTARDPANASATRSFTIAVANPAPVAVDDSASTTEDTPVTITVLTNDSDPDGDPLTVTSASALHGSVAINPDGTLRYTPNANYNGSDTITYAISDGQGGTATARVAVTIAAANDAPTPVGTLPARATSDAATVSYPTAGAFADPDGDTLTYSATGLPAGLTINAVTGVISGTINHSASVVNGGNYTVVVIARDPSNATATQRFAMTVANPAPIAVNDSASTPEDTPVTIDVLGNDSDPDGDTLLVKTATALHGTVTINPDNTLRYTPNANYTGTDTITYRIVDDDGGIALATVAVTITPVNDAPTPVGTLPARATSDAATVSYPTASGFGDIDGDTLTYSATGLPAGLTIDAATGVISGTINHAASVVNGGNYTVIVTARDPSNATATQRFAMTVTNPAPIAVDDSASTPEDTPVTIDVLGNDSDPDGDTLLVKTATALHGTVTINPDNTLRYTPNANYTGTDTITYRIVDDDGGIALATVAVTITPVEDAPTAVGTLPPRDGLDGAAVSFATAGGFTDVDGDALTYSATGLPTGLTIDPATGIISGTLDRSASQANDGAYAIVVTARDPAGASATQGFTLTVANPTPIARDDSASTTEDMSVTIPVLGNDSDPDGDPLSVTSASALHGTVAINPNGTLRYTPNADYNGNDTITYTISDGQGGSATAAVAITIAPANDAPTAAGTLPGRSSTDAASVSYPTAGGFADIDGDALTYSASGLPVGLTIDPATGIISGTIDRSASVPNGGRYVVTVTATDPSGALVRQNFPLDIANPAPTAQNDAVRTHVDTPITVAVLANDSDPDGDPLSVVSATTDTGTVAINADGSLLYTPPAGFAGRATVTYTISDGQGGSGTATLTIDIANAAPTVDPIAPVAAGDGQPVDLPLGPRFSDADGDTLTFTATGLPPGLTIDPVTGRVTGTLFRSASQVNGGIYDATVTASDGHGGTVSTIVRFTIANPAPVARDEAVSTPEDTPIIIAVLANDSDPDGDPVTVIFATAANGRVSINPDGTITYRPNPDFTGVDQVRYTISDGEGGTAMATGTVTVTPANDAPTTTGIPDRITADGITVSKPVAPSFGDPDGDSLTYTVTGLPPGLTIDPMTGVISGTIQRGSANGGPNGDGVYRAIVTATDPSGATVTAPFFWTVSQTAPDAQDDSATTPEDTPVVIPVLANDSDSDNDRLTIVGAIGTHGTASIVGDTIRFTPDPDFNGVATVVYTVSDPAGHRATATVTITVTPADDAPVAVGTPSAAPARDGQTIALDVGGFFRDPDGDPLRFGATGLPAGLSIDPATGRITGTIARDASRTGIYRVTITATDPSGATVSSSFDWTIANPAPIARDDTATVAEDTATIIPVLGNDSDPDGDPLTVVAASAPNGTVTINPDGTLRYVPNANFNGNDVISYTIDDGNGGRATASVLVTVTPVDDAPIVVAPPPAPIATQDGARLTLPTANWFSDPDGDILTYTATGLPDGLSIDPRTGIISGTVDRAASGTNGGVYPVLVSVRDPNGGNTGTTVVLRVTNPAPIATDDTARTIQNGPGVTIPVLANDRDPDGDPLTVLTANAINGTTTINPDGSLRYVPGPGFSGTDFIRYTISDGQGGTAFAFVTVTVDPLNRAPIVAGRDPVSVPGGLPVRIDVLTGARDPDGDPITITGASVATGTVRVNPDGTLTYAPPLGFVGTTTISYTLSDGRGGVSTGTILVRVTPGDAADVEQLLRIGRVTFQDPTPALATVVTRDGVVRNPLSLLDTVDNIRSLRGTSIGDQPVGDAVEAIRSLRGTSIDPDAPILAEVARLDAIRDQRDTGDKLFDQRWGDFMVKGLTGFSAADDRHACIMVESVVRGGAIYLEVRDTATEGARAPVRSVDVRLANGKHADWITVDPRGLAIIERAADMDELHLVVRVTRTDGSTSSTPILVQGQTGEVELDRKLTTTRHAAPLDMTLQTPNAAIQAEATRLAGLFQ